MLVMMCRGIIQTSHACDPGAIPGMRIFPLPTVFGMRRVNHSVSSRLRELKADSSLKVSQAVPHPSTDRDGSKENVFKAPLAQWLERWSYEP